jgi:pimeloyl-ACP methyl ester carboxylesterase
MPRLRTVLWFVALLVLGACGSLEDSADAVRMMWKIADPPPMDPAARREVVWTVGDVERAADLYEPQQQRAAIVVAPGLGRHGRRDVRLVALAGALTSAGYRVLVPDVPNFQAQRVAADDSAVLADALRYMLEKQGESGTVSIAAISYAVGPAVLAAMEPDIAPRVSAIAAVGGYYDSHSVVTFFTTGYFRDRTGGPWQHRTPNAYGKWVFVLANAERIGDERDRESLMAMARLKLANLNADIGQLGAGLGPEGRSVVALLANTDPDRVSDLIDALPPAVRNDLDALSLARRDLGKLRARLILIHGRDDGIIPYAESVALAGAMPRGRAHLSLLDNLMHADLGPASVADAYRLWLAAYELMRSRHEAVDSDGRSASIN